MWWAPIVRLFTGDLIGALERAHKARLAAKNNEQRIAADIKIKAITAEMERQAASAATVRAGMEHKAFWIPWLLAAVPLSAWFAWGIADSMLNGALPDVATLPPQLKEYADIVWGNIFYVGGGVAGAQILAGVLRR